MQAKAVLRHQRTSAQKVRLVADMVRNKAIGQAFQVLEFTRKEASSVVRKVIESALANAEHNHDMDLDALYVQRIYVDEGVTLKRIRARAKGRAARILKRSCHVTVILSDEQTR